MAAVPLIFQKRWFSKDNHFWHANLGTTVRYTPNVLETERYIFNDLYFTLKLETNPEKKIWLTYNAGGGYSMVFKK
jgi:hypothetical protein